MRFIYVFIVLFSTLCANAQITSAVRDVKGQRELGELDGTYIYNEAFPNEIPKYAYLQCWRTNPQTSKEQFDSLTISKLQTHWFRERINGEDVPCSCLIHYRIVLKGLQIYHQRYKRDGKVYKEEKYYALGTHERWNSHFEFRDKNDYAKYNSQNIGKRQRIKYKQSEYQMEITKDFFDWLHQLSNEWKVTEKESEDIKDLDKESSGYDPLWWLW